jgi:hypothetical protein
MLPDHTSTPPVCSANRGWTRVVWKHWTTQTPLQTGSELVWSGSIEQHKLHYKQGVNSCVVWHSLFVVEFVLFNASRPHEFTLCLYWSLCSSMLSDHTRVHSLFVVKFVLFNASRPHEYTPCLNSTTNREWTRGATQTPLQTESELVEQHKLHYKQGVNLG